MMTAVEEQDPNGKDQHEPGSKTDFGKVKCALVLSEFSQALFSVSAVGTFGSVKYTPSGWLTVPNGVERYSDAMMRHLLKHWSGESNDPDSGLPHLHHALWNLLAVVELGLREDCKKEMS